MAASERIPVLATPEEKRRIAKRAKAFGFKSVGSFLKEAADVYTPISKSDEKVLDRMLNEMRTSTETTSKGIDDMLEEVAESEARIEKMESEANALKTLRPGFAFDNIKALLDLARSAAESAQKQNAKTA